MTGAETSVAFRSAKERGFRGAKGDHATVVDSPVLGMSRRTVAAPPCRAGPRMIAALLLVLEVLAGTSRGGTVVNFGNLSLAPSSYWNGSDGSGGFTSGGVVFNNSYDNDAWSGWSYSNVNNTTTGDYTNQYAACTGTAVGGAGIYAVAYGYSGMLSYGGVLPTITVPTGMQVQSAMFTNTTYAAYVMQNGSWFSGPFGPSDWFLLTITGEGPSNNVLGSVNFYLAQNGLIVNTWQSVDLSSLSLARTLEFDLTSSDTGPNGMNTPAYFAMDDLVLSSTASAMSGNWVYTGSTTGSWKNGNNWSPATVPSGGTATVMFPDTSNAPITVTLDGRQSVGGLVFDVSGTNGYTLSQGTGGAH